MSYSVGEALVFDTFANIPSALTGSMVFAADTGLQYVWNTTLAAYIPVSPNAPRIFPITSTATPSVDCTKYDQVNITALAIAVTGVTVTGTAFDGQPLDFRIKGDATPRAIAFGASFTGVLLTTTVASKTVLQRCKWDSVAAKWAGYYVEATGY